MFKFSQENIGKAAVTRGAIVYCTEEADNGKNLQLLSISKNSKMKVNSDLTITASGYREKEDEKLYFNYKESTYEKKISPLSPIINPATEVKMK